MRPPSSCGGTARGANEIIATSILKRMVFEIGTIQYDIQFIDSRGLKTINRFV